MATVTHQLQPEGASFLTTAFPQYKRIAGSNFPVTALFYDASTDEAAFWKLIATSYGSGNLTLNIYWYADTASSANVVWEAQVSCITPNTDSQDVETDGLATLNFVQDTHLGTTGQRVHHCAITISNTDSIAAGDVLHVRIARDANGTSATDDMTGDAALILATLTYSDS
jgi:hypothetical protein